MIDLESITSSRKPIPRKGWYMSFVISSSNQLPTSNGQHNKSPKPKFRGKKDFKSRIQRGADLYFRLSGRSPNDQPGQYLKSVVLFLWLVASYVFLVFLSDTWWQVALTSLSLALSMTAVGFCIQHDGNHGSLSKRKWINRIAGTSLDVIGGSSHYWKQKHNGAHHTYTNIEGHDEDIDLGILGRLSPEQKRFWFHKYQHVYLWILYGFIVIRWQLWNDFHALIKGEGKRPRGTNLAVFIAGKLAFFSLAFVLPALLHQIWVVAVVYLAICWVMGILLAVVFQLAHVVEETAFPKPHPDTHSVEDEWAQHQVRTTADFAPRNKLVMWFSGGLNHQIEHHLFPHVSHTHYPAIARIVKRTCQKFGLPYNVHPSIWSAVRSHFRHIRAMGRPSKA